MGRKWGNKRVRERAAVERASRVLRAVVYSSAPLGSSPCWIACAVLLALFFKGQLFSYCLKESLTFSFSFFFFCHFLPFCT